MPAKKTAKRSGRRKKQVHADAPIPEPTPEQLAFIADLERRYTEALQRQACDVCSQGWRLPKRLLTSPNGTPWTICIVCCAALRDLDSATMKAVMLKRVDKMDWLLMRLPYLREWLDDKTCFNELERQVA